jgi:hypothetical protein
LKYEVVFAVSYEVEAETEKDALATAKNEFKIDLRMIQRRPYMTPEVKKTEATELDIKANVRGRPRLRPSQANLIAAFKIFIS